MVSVPVGNLEASERPEVSSGLAFLFHNPAGTERCLNSFVWTVTPAHDDEACAVRLSTTVLVPLPGEGWRSNVEWNLRRPEAATT